MTKTLLGILKMSILALCLAMPAQALAESFGVEHKTQKEVDWTQVEITASESNLRVKNADGFVIEVFSLTGSKVFTARIEGDAVSIDLAHLKKAIYIVRVGKVSRKCYLGQM